VNYGLEVELKRENDIRKEEGSARNHTGISMVTYTLFHRNQFIRNILEEKVIL